ncbi:MAG: hypothetical protein Q8N77_00545 [Nanoarchaeota archaeon]|nr:hypothetical protein [Nanoarchaeota archaeon]
MDHSPVSLVRIKFSVISFLDAWKISGPKLIKDYRRYEVLKKVMKDNTKYIIPEGTDLITVLGDEKDKIIPVPKGEKKQ